MKVQVLIATMNQNDMSKVSEMNIQTDAIFANQSDKYDYEEKLYHFGIVKMITTKTRGVGINRNMALLHADGDFLLFGDDDVTYKNGYDQIINDAFDEIPNADAIIFNVESSDKDSIRKMNNRIKRVRWHNSMSYGAIRICVRREALFRENIMFNLNFGGGTLFSSGEDSLFIHDMLKHGLKIFTYPKVIALVDDDLDKSTWFKGYNEKYYYDKGVLFKTLNKNIPYLLCLQDLLRHSFYKECNLTFFTAFHYMRKGIKGQRFLQKYMDKKEE